MVIDYVAGGWDVAVSRNHMDRGSFIRLSSKGDIITYQRGVEIARCCTNRGPAEYTIAEVYKLLEGDPS